MSERNKSLVILNFGVLLLGLNAILAKAISLDAGVTIFIRAFVALLALFFIQKLLKVDRLKVTRNEFITQIGLGLLMGAHWVTYFHSIKVSTIAIAMISTFTFSVFTAVLEPFITKKKHQLQDILLALFVFFGVLMMAPDWDLNNQSTQGILWGLLSSILFSFRNIYSRTTSSRLSAIKVMSYQMIGVLMISSPFLFFNTIEITGNDVGYLILMGVFTTAVAHTIFVQSLKKLNAKTASIFSGMQVVYGVFFAFLIFQETLDLREVVGGSIILASVVLESTFQYKKSQEVIEMEH